MDPGTGIDEDRLLAALNPQQREAVTAGPGPVLVLAGPGSGKTRVLTHRVAWLVAVAGVEPWRLMAVTFTNKAAREMRHRVGQLVGEEALGRVTMGTFHATCARMLRTEAAALGRAPDFVIFDQSDQLQAVKRCFGDVGVDPDRFDPRSFLAAIGKAKNELIRASEYSPASYFEELVARVYARYQELLRLSNALDFDDLLLEAADALARHEELRLRYRRRYRHVLVDEFQDTNTAQYALVKSLIGTDSAAGERNLFVVGDEDQSIYGWRGADYRNIERFRRDFPDSRLVLLEQNYRSTQNILDAARAVIDRNVRRTPKRLWTEAGDGMPIGVFDAFDADEEAAFVVDQIERELRAGGGLGDHAVMYRTNAQSRPVEDALVARGLPYQLVGATRFYERREVKDLVAYLRLIFNPFDEFALARVINVPPRGIGARSYQALCALAVESGVPRWTALQRIARGDSDDPASHLEMRLSRGLVAFHDLLRDLVDGRERLTPAQLLEFCLERSGYGAWLRDGTPEGEERWENVVELHAVASDFGGTIPGEGLADLLESIALVSDVDNLTDGVDRVTVLTLHAAKGLEFPTVFLIGLEEGLLPHSRCVDDPDAMAEERRLFYVGITRAERKLFLARARRRTVFGTTDDREPSRFLADVPLDLTDSVGRSGMRDTRSRTSRFEDTRWPPARAGARGGVGPGRADGSATTVPGGGAESHRGFRPGDKVVHQTFGRGTVISCSRSTDDEELTVAFEGAGVRKLLASLARLERG